MDSFSTQDAQHHFHDVLKKAQSTPIEICENGKTLAVVISPEEFSNLEAMKLQFVKARFSRANHDIEESKLIDGGEFMDALVSGKYDNTI